MQLLQLRNEIKFTSSKEAEEDHVIHSKKDNTKFTSYNDANRVVNDFFDSLNSRYQVNLETSMEGSEFIFDSVQNLNYNCHKVIFKRGGLTIDSLDWIKKKKQQKIQKIKMINVFPMW